MSFKPKKLYSSITFLPYNSNPNPKIQSKEIKIHIKPDKEKLERKVMSFTITNGHKNNANNTAKLSFDKIENPGTTDNKSVNAIWYVIHTPNKVKIILKSVITDPISPVPEYANWEYVEDKPTG